jgi:hypothetical protein
MTLFILESRLRRGCRFFPSQERTRLRHHLVMWNRWTRIVDGRSYFVAEPAVVCLGFFVRGELGFDGGKGSVHRLKVHQFEVECQSGIKSESLINR